MTKTKLTFEDGVYAGYNRLLSDLNYRITVAKMGGSPNADVLIDLKRFLTPPKAIIEETHAQTAK